MFDKKPSTLSIVRPADRASIILAIPLNVYCIPITTKAVFSITALC